MAEPRRARQTDRIELSAPVYASGAWINREAERERRRQRIQRSLLLADTSAERHGIYPTRKV